MLRVWDTTKNLPIHLQPDEHEQAKNDLNEFVYNLRNHFNEEERIVFPLALKAEASD
jgi:iron-sulfur cluster repair protein YtfE (RIC family)